MPDLETMPWVEKGAIWLSRSAAIKSALNGLQHLRARLLHLRRQTSYLNTW
jgi:hypothetical protein